jgi:hypothetical protein
MLALLRRKLRDYNDPPPAPDDAWLDGWPNLATAGVAANLNSEHLDAVMAACLALAERDYGATGPNGRAIARSLLAGALRDWCDQIATAGDITPLAELLVQVGLAEVDWDELARRKIDDAL